MFRSDWIFRAIVYNCIHVCMYVSTYIYIYMYVCICIYIYMYEEVKSKHHGAWVLACAFSVDCKWSVPLNRWEAIASPTWIAKSKTLPIGGLWGPWIWFGFSYLLIILCTNMRTQICIYIYIYIYLYTYYIYIYIYMHILYIYIRLKWPRELDPTLQEFRCVFSIGDALYLSTFETLAATVTAVVKVVDLQTATCRCSSISSLWLNLRIFARSRTRQERWNSNLCHWIWDFVV